VAAMLEMYVQGISTREAQDHRRRLCVHEFSSSAISRIVGRLDQEREHFARRRLEEPYPYLIFDARYEKVREEGAVRSQAVLVAIGINGEGRRNIPAVEVPQHGTARTKEGSAAQAGRRCVKEQHQRCRWLRNSGRFEFAELVAGASCMLMVRPASLGSRFCPSVEPLPERRSYFPGKDDC